MRIVLAYVVGLALGAVLGAMVARKPPLRPRDDLPTRCRKCGGM